MGSGSLRRLFKRESSTEEEIKQLVDEDEAAKYWNEMWQKFNDLNYR